MGFEIVERTVADGHSSHGLRRCQVEHTRRDIANISVLNMQMFQSGQLGQQVRKAGRNRIGAQELGDGTVRSGQQVVIGKVVGHGTFNVPVDSVKNDTKMTLKRRQMDTIMTPI